VISQRGPAEAPSITVLLGGRYPDIANLFDALNPHGIVPDFLLTGLWKMARDPIDHWIDRAIEADPVELDFDEFDAPSGPPPSPEEIDAARVSLAQWQSPAAFKASVDALCAQLKFLHDALVLARFARHQRADKVRLAEPSAQWPDGFVQVAGKTHYIEVTSTHGGRKLGDEYRQVEGPTMDPVENWAARGDSIPEFLNKTVSAKSKKHYSAPCWLVVYLNISEYGARQKETEATIAEVRARYAGSFEAISVLWKGRLY
jgi:hypothetical protein